ncbi:tetratricopeptide repeat protein [Vineibacter terrae]|uniref:Tetratricopeptide repeat protein n=2 Tax=Vineibacter terrae TaxID=2586908 RepID=A0A5C8P9Y3_9HYPH|nr:tetratricopeptide repeat protein [Vineibacter terrae]TXL70581.1 tetratricopeptide repeat protein [Vineibacter terrae]
MLAVAAIVLAGYYLLAPRSPSETPSSAVASRPPTYVGAAACGQCHQDQLKAWTGSHHDRAMQKADGRTVVGDFNNARFVHYGIESTFYSRNGRYFVHTEGADGALTDFEIAYTFGVYPLQQYLIAFPGGRLQALSIAWDSRPKVEGGQRWFHLIPDEEIAHDDPLHWTGLYQNWNLQCAECHSTNLRKGYDAEARIYRTTFSEINVACEACHGPGSRHVTWAAQSSRRGQEPADKGLAVHLQSRWDVAWRFAEQGGPIARRDAPPDAALMNVCAACHARRSTLADGVPAGAPLEETHRLAMLVPPGYHADGQQRDEVYTWGSFLQSRMFRQGVTCMDCHEPHALKLRAEGNAVCGRCHDPAAFDTPRHHFHSASGKGTACVDCHMPAQTYMIIDARRDHGFRIPRPDVSGAIDAPNACTTCHTTRDAGWAASAMDGWYGSGWRKRPQHGLAVHAGLTQGARALPSLLELARDPAYAPVVRATAATIAQPHMRPALLPLARALLRDPDPLVRIAALGLVEPFPAAIRLEAATALLGDGVQGVRFEAARLLADIPDGQLPPAQRAIRDTVTNAYIASLKENLDWPAANVTLGNLLVRQGRLFEAFQAYRQALALDSKFVGAYVNLADLHRQEGTDIEGEKVLRRGLELLPQSAELHHALGLRLVRANDLPGALRELGEAAASAPDNPRHAYVYAIALHSAGRRQEAMAILTDADARHPYDPDILGALVSLAREQGAVGDALRYARLLLEVLPDDPGVSRLVRELER